ncbi:hypothetical protein DVH24_009728 [Malus domestica]|uniref:Uncharacterized protein n=1 Tax=Malus domestica TaxID=3750 RepID=A0A498JPA5_MALDO|nr:hypothetical protein DVH24_009728 [Malus domestica]
MILEFISFIRLRVKYPATSRPYKIPVGTVGAILMCIPPTILICVVLALSTLKIVVVSLVAILIGLVMQPCLTYVERKRWMKFSVSADLPDLHGANQEGVGSIRHYLQDVGVEAMTARYEFMADAQTTASRGVKTRNNLKESVDA